MKKYTVGIDFGTLSGRAVLMDAESGEVVASATSEYSCGVIDRELPSGKRLPTKTALQNASDYIDVLETTVRAVLKDSGVAPECVAGIGIDFTGCTVMPVDENMCPLMFDDKYKDEMHAYVKLWKHTSAQKEGDIINEIADARDESWFKIYGCKTSSELMFAKILQVLREAPHIYDAAYMFVHTADWITYLLTGEITHSESFAGYKALWNSETGFPSKEFFEAVDPRMKDIIGTKVCDKTLPLKNIAGRLNAEGARLIGLCEGTPVATPIIDAHASLPASGITEEGRLMMILGTSGSYLVHSGKKKDVKGIAGYVKDGVIPGLYTYEACQACCGDHLDWFVHNCVPAAYINDAKEKGMNIHKYLRERAKSLRVGESGLLCLDWHNGNRSILTDVSLTGALFGMTLQTRPEEIYRAFIEGTVFGARRIFENFEENGIAIEQVTASGGIAEKDEMFVQICADVLNRSILVTDADMAASRGSAICAAVAAGLYPDLTTASKALGVHTGVTYTPVPENVKAYDKLYAEYKRLHDYFGCGENNVLKNLRGLCD